MLTLKDALLISTRFISNLFLFAILSVHVLIKAVPEFGRPALVAAAIAAGLLVAMYDSGVFSVYFEEDEN